MKFRRNKGGDEGYVGLNELFGAGSAGETARRRPELDENWFFSKAEEMMLNPAISQPVRADISQLVEMADADPAVLPQAINILTGYVFVETVIPEISRTLSE